MKVYNQEKNKILENYDLSKGFLIDDKIIIKPSQAEVFHYEMRKYKNAGIEKIKVIDQPHKDAVFEEIKVYVPYTSEQLKANRIEEIKQEMESLSQDFIQYYLGGIIENIEERKARFISIHNELRELLGKQPRIYK